IVLLALSAIIWGRPLAATFALALNSDEYTHILLIFPVSAALLFLEWRSSKLSPAPGLQTGSGLLLLAILVGSINRWGAPNLSPDVHLSMSMLALVTWW